MCSKVRLSLMNEQAPIFLFNKLSVAMLRTAKQECFTHLPSKSDVAQKIAVILLEKSLKTERRSPARFIISRSVLLRY